MDSTVRVVFLNGVGSAGKTSIAKALQTITTEPFLHVQMDTFLDMLPEAYHNHPDGCSYETVREDGTPRVAIKIGPVAERALKGMRHAIAAMAGQGNNLIVDNVILGGATAEYAGLLSRFEVIMVGIFAPLDVLESRERRRDDRLIGLARWQYHRVHRGVNYDLEIETSKLSPMECASLIKERFLL